MATITKRGDSYRIRVSCGYTAQGKQIVKSTTWKPPAGLTAKQTEKELNRIAVEFEAKVTGGDSTEMSTMKVADFCDRYLEMAETTLSPNTFVFYKSVIETLVKPSLGHMKLNAVKPIHAQQFIQMLQGDGVRNDGRGERLSASTVKRYFTVLKSIFAKAYKLDLIDRNPTDTTKLDLPEVDEPEIKIFTAEEAQYMLSCLEKEETMFQVLIHLAIVTGMRRGELCAMKWSNIDLKQGLVIVKQSNYKLTGEEIKTKKPKNKKSREIVIPDYLKELLHRHQLEQMQNAMRLGDKWHGDGWIFTQWNGEPMNPQTPTKQFTKFLARNNIPHRKFHSLRHTSATLLLSSGTNIKNVASRLGHSQLSTTNRYVHALRDADERAASTFETLFAEQDKGKNGDGENGA